MEINEQVKESILLRRLIITFQTAAMQQMGKLADPFSGKVQHDLEQASISIDTLDMLQKVTKGNLSENDAAFLTHVVSELKLNYVDEIGRKAEKPEEKEDSKEKTINDDIKDESNEESQETSDSEPTV
ncbi:DUF1844 domain-containing protein [bacterium]|nr:DUF1844 domain-containing protein [bacterium]